MLSGDQNTTPFGRIQVCIVTIRMGPERLDYLWLVRLGNGGCLASGCFGPREGDGEPARGSSRSDSPSPDALGANFRKQRRTDHGCGLQKNSCCRTESALTACNL